VARGRVERERRTERRTERERGRERGREGEGRGGAVVAARHGACWAQGRGRGLEGCPAGAHCGLKAGCGVTRLWASEVIGCCD